MRRRDFLRSFTATLSAPFLPAASVAQTRSVTAVTPAAIQAALHHARSRAVFSVWGLAKATKMSPDAAFKVMEHLAHSGHLGPLQGMTHGGRWAQSRVMERMTAAKVKALKDQAVDKAQHWSGQTRQADFEVNLDGLLRHLRALADRHLSISGQPDSAPHDCTVQNA